MSDTELVIHLTYRCPLACSHCCFSSDMSREGHLDLDEILQAIDDASRLPSMRRLEFVGGDPFMHADLMLVATRHARERGFHTVGAVTSAYWAGSAERARRELEPLAEAGLSVLTISFDDMHAEFVRSKVVGNAYRAARDLGLLTKVAVTLQPGCSIDRAAVLDILGAGEDDAGTLIVYETFINSVGRAKSSASSADLAARRRDERVYRGGCGSVLRNFSVTADRYVEPCCGVIPYQSALSSGRLGERPLDEMILEACDDPVLKWLAFEGPVEILKQITRDDAVPAIDEDFDGICTACEALFSSPGNLEKLQAALPDKQHSLAIQELIYRAAGLFDPPSPAPGRPADRASEGRTGTETASETPVRDPAVTPV